MGMVVVISLPLILFSLLLGFGCYYLGRARGRQDIRTNPQVFGVPAPPPGTGSEATTFTYPSPPPPAAAAAAAKFKPDNSANSRLIEKEDPIGHQQKFYSPQVFGVPAPPPGTGSEATTFTYPSPPPPPAAAAAAKFKPDNSANV